VPGVRHWKVWPCQASDTETSDRARRQALKRLTVPGVRQLVAGFFIADAQVRCQPSPCVPFSVQSDWDWIFASRYAVPYRCHITSDIYSYCAHVSPIGVMSPVTYTRIAFMCYWSVSCHQWHMLVLQSCVTNRCHVTSDTYSYCTHVLPIGVMSPVTYTRIVLMCHQSVSCHQRHILVMHSCVTDRCHVTSDTLVLQSCVTNRCHVTSDIYSYCTHVSPIGVMSPVTYTRIAVMCHQSVSCHQWHILVLQSCVTNRFHVTSDTYSYCTHVSPMLFDRTFASVGK